MVNSHRTKGIYLTATDLFFLFSETNQKHQASNPDSLRTGLNEQTSPLFIICLFTHKLGISGLQVLLFFFFLFIVCSAGS